MAEVLLTSEEFVKSISNISDNLAGKYMLPAIREAQEINLREILGDALTDRLKKIVELGQTNNPENAIYKELIEVSQYFLAYQTIAGLPYKVGYKIGNIGVAKTTDTNVQGSTLAEISNIQNYYQSKADFYAAKIQRFALENYTQLPELTQNDCYHIRKNLHSSATCSIWLGGARGKIYGKK